MAFNLGSSNASATPDVLVDINTTPLIDVMLVLLIMLIITLPIQLHSVSLNNPIGHPPPPVTPPEVVRIDIGADNIVYWNGEALADLPDLEVRLGGTAALAVPPELHVRPDKRTAYRTVAAVLAAVQRRGLTKIGIVGNEQYL
jgi:biopolymer transport protein ExbD